MKSKTFVSCFININMRNVYNCRITATKSSIINQRIKYLVKFINRDAMWRGQAHTVIIIQWENAKNQISHNH